MNATPPKRNGGGSVKTLAIRLEEELHGALSAIAQLRGTTITDEIRQAIEAHLHGLQESDELSARAEAVLEEIERDATERKQAIAKLFGTTAASSPPSPKAPPRGKSQSNPTA